MYSALRQLFDCLVTAGNLRVVDTYGRAYSFGDGRGAPLTVRLADKKLEYQLSFNPALSLGEAYMNGRLQIEGGTIYDFLELMLAHSDPGRFPIWLKIGYRMRELTKRLQQHNPEHRSRRNVAHHYNIDGAIYDLFLDTDRQYSCAYFEHEGQGLEAAQQAKKQHLAAKLHLSDGQKILDIGSGWGGLGLYLARCADVSVTGVTLSEEQLEISRSRAQKLGLARSADFRLCDYRHLQGSYDRIVSVGMFEHVGIGHYKNFFSKINDLLADDGVAVLHSIGRLDGPGATNPFIAKYIFPGGYIPALSEVIPAIERSGLLMTDIEILRLHYADTLRHWRTRFLANRDRAAMLLGDRFCRMWEFYLAGSETAFRYENLMVFQIQMAKEQTALPLTRDYMHVEESRLRSHSRAVAELPRLADGSSGRH